MIWLWSTYALLSAGLLGWLLVSPLIAAPGQPRTGLRLALAAGLGLGLTSAGYYLALLLFGPGRLPLLLVEGVMLALAYAWYRRPRPANDQPQFKPHTPTPNQRLFATSLFTIALSAGLLRMLRYARLIPIGIGDSLMIWNLRAIFLYRGGLHWTDAFAVTPASHPDYPLLVPASISRIWVLIGTETPVVQVVVGLILALSTVLLLYFGLSALYGQIPALLAGLVLVGTPYFTEQVAFQYADIPISYFYLATLFFISWLWQQAAPDLKPLALAGLSAGLAAWTKNEGLLFLGLAFVIVIVFSRHREAPLRRILTFLAGAAPMLVVITLFKVLHAPPNDLYSGLGAGSLTQLFSIDRHLRILAAFGQTLLDFGRWGYPFPLLLVLLIFIPGLTQARLSAWRPAAGLVFVTLAGYYLVYVFTPKDLDWHLWTSLSRLILQLWPGALLVLFSAVRYPARSPASAAD